MLFIVNQIKRVMISLPIICATLITSTVSAADVRFSFNSKTGVPEQAVGDKSVLCSNQYSLFCTANSPVRPVTLDMPELELTGKTFPTYNAATTVADEQSYFKWDANQQTVELTEPNTGVTFTLGFKVKRISMNYGVSNTKPPNLPIPSALSTNYPSQLQNQCTPTNSSGGEAGLYVSNRRYFFNATAEAYVHCAAAMTLHQTQYGGPFVGGGSAVALLLELNADFPKLASGTYKGTFHATVGPGQFFDVGPYGSISTASIPINFEVTVDNSIKISGMPLTARLVPPQGWSRWSSTNPPPRLRAKLPFMLETNAGLKVYLDCSNRRPDGHCGINKVSSAGGNSEVSVQAFLSANYITKEANGPNGPAVSREPLGINAASAVRMIPRAISTYAAASVDLEVDQIGINELMQHTGNEYRGTLTFIFEWSPGS